MADKFLTKRRIPLYLLNQYAEEREVLDDMDLAILIRDTIFEMLKRKIKPILDFEGITKIHPYWFVLCLIKYVLKAKGKVNNIIGVTNITPNQLKLMNIVAVECYKNGEEILNGTMTSILPDDETGDY